MDTTIKALTVITFRYKKIGLRYVQEIRVSRPIPRAYKHIFKLFWIMKFTGAVQWFQ